MRVCACFLSLVFSSSFRMLLRFFPLCHVFLFLIFLFLRQCRSVLYSHFSKIRKALIYELISYIVDEI